MPAPVAKGIIITASVLVAAGIAVYQSPQFQKLVSNSRRKVALALHNVGDEIYPQDRRTPLREDISMTEEVGEAAEERRRVAREEIMRRRSLLEERQQRKESQPLEDFDSIVGEDGTLKPDSSGKSPDAVASSTAVDVSGSQVLHRGGKQNESSTATTTAVAAPGLEPYQQHALLETMERDRLHIALPSDAASSSHPSEALVDLTPTSEVPDGHATSIHGKPDEVSQSGYFSVASGRLSSASSSHTENETSGLLYAHPDDANHENHPGLQTTSPFADPEGYEQSLANSTAGSLSHTYESAGDASSTDDTLSDLGRESIATPNSWSEIGSVVSDDFEHHQ